MNTKTVIINNVRILYSTCVSDFFFLNYDVDISEKYKVVVKYTLYLAPIKLRY